MTIRMTEKELKDFFAKSGKESNAAEPQKKLGIKVKEKIVDLNNNCTIEVYYNQDYISILFIGARLLSINQIFSILQYRKHDIFQYKIMWQKLIDKALSDKKDLPTFNENCELILFRQSARLVDNDALTAMFKYIIDALKLDKDNKKAYYVLTEDNPKVVSNIKFIQKKDKQHIVGIRIQKDKNINDKTLEDFVSKKHF